MRRTVVLAALLLAGCSTVPPLPEEPIRPDMAIDPPFYDQQWRSQMERPPLPTPGWGPQARLSDAEALGDVWEEEEENRWAGTWVRRGQSSVFDGYWVHPGGERVLATLHVTRRGQEVNIVRRHGDGQHCTYAGRIAENWVDVAGVYQCSWFRHSSPWQARIVRMRDVSPAILANGGWRRSD